MKRLFLVAAVAALPTIALAQDAVKPPVAAQKPYVVKGPKDRVDPYYWMRDDTRKAPRFSPI